MPDQSSAERGVLHARMRVEVTLDLLRHGTEEPEHVDGVSRVRLHASIVRATDDSGLAAD